MRPNLYAEIFDPPPGVDADALTRHIHEVEEQDLEFDAYFDFSDHTRLFCTEFVELTLRAAGAESTSLVPMRQNPSLATLLRWVQLPTKEMLPAGLFIDRERYRAALGQFDSRVTAHAYFAAKRELHRRFTDEQRLGSVFRMQASSNITLRPEVFDFLNRAVHTFDDAPPPSLEVIETRIGALADELLGP